MSCFKMSKNKDKDNKKDTTHNNNVDEIIENIDKKNCDNILNDIYKDKINTIFTDIKNIVKINSDSKSDDVKAAEACFRILGQEPHSLCPHGLQFFQCMPCSH